jgi:hypothetical protein
MVRTSDNFEITLGRKLLSDFGGNAVERKEFERHSILINSLLEDWDNKMPESICVPSNVHSYPYFLYHSWKHG